MREKLAELKAEFEKGQEQMALLDQRRQELRDTMLRISGAIQALEELIAQNGHNAAEDVTLESAS